MDIDPGKETLNPLLECAANIFSLIAPLRRGDQGAGLDAGLREKIRAAFEEMERLAFERRVTSPVLRDARYALAALVDEVVLSSRWPGRGDWMSRTLQLEMFGDHLAGERFFEKLALLRQGGEIGADLLELYYVCLQLGFEGIYKIRGLEQLTALQVDLRSQIEHYRGTIDPRLSPQGIPRTGILERTRREVPSWVIGVVTVAVVFFTYLGYSLAAGRLMQSSVAAIETSCEGGLRPTHPLPPEVAR